MSIQNNLKLKIEAFQSLELAKSHLEKLEERITGMHQKLSRLEVILEKEYNDIEQLEKLSMRALFEKVLGDKEAQLEKERQEYLHAALNYNECKKSLELLNFERDVLVKKLENYNEVKSELHNLIRQREHSLLIENELAKQLITDINAKIDANIAFKRELHEAINLGLKIKKTLLNITSNLKRVTSWGEYVVNQHDLNIRKMVYVNKARDQAYIAKQLLQEFEDELSDIYDSQHILIQSSLQIFRYFISSFFDNLISDWVVLMKIQNALYTVHQVNDKVSRITKSLQHDLKQTERTMNKLIDKKEKIILELNEE